MSTSEIRQVHDLCGEFGIKIIEGTNYPELGETRAIVTLVHIMRHYGEGHLRLVLTTLFETANNKALLDSVGLWMTSDLIRAYSNVVEHRADDWLQTWDAMPVGELQFICQELRGIVRQRHALGGMVHERLYRRFGPNADQPDLFDDRRMMR